MKQSKLLAILCLALLVLGLIAFPILAQDEAEGEEMEEPGYGIPEGYDVTVTDTGTVHFVSGDNSITIITSADYANVIGDQAFESDADELSFFLDRGGYSAGVEQSVLPSGALTAVGTTLSRRSQQGIAYLYDLGRDRFAVISLHTGRGQIGAPLADVETVVSEFTFLGTIVDIAIENAAGGDEDRAGLSFLVQAVQNADESVAELLSGEGNYTVFAPTNQAFYNLFALLQTYGLSASDLLADENQELLTQVLLYHVVEGDVFAEDVVALGDRGLVSTLLADPQNGITIRLNDEGVPRLNNSVDLVTTDILASNGVVHVIDDVLLPACVVSTLEGTGSCGAGEGDE